MKNVMIYVFGVICGILFSIGTLFNTGHMNANFEQVAHTFTIETTQFNGFEFQ